jgi:hypothetical protein
MLRSFDVTLRNASTQSVRLRELFIGGPMVRSSLSGGARLKISDVCARWNEIKPQEYGRKSC